MLNCLRNILVKCQPFAKYILVFWIITIIVFSSLPASMIPNLGVDRILIRIDYIAHFSEYGLLAFLSLLTFSGRQLSLSRRLTIRIVVLLSLFALGDEFHQLLIPTRTFSYLDLLADFAGLITAVVLFAIIVKNGNRGQN